MTITNGARYRSKIRWIDRVIVFRNLRVFILMMEAAMSFDTYVQSRSSVGQTY
jgi:hypothetical protein